MRDPVLFRSMVGSRNFENGCKPVLTTILFDHQENALNPAHMPDGDAARIFKGGGGQFQIPWVWSNISP